LKTLRSNPYLKTDQSSAITNLLNTSPPPPSSGDAEAVSGSAPVADKAMRPSGRTCRTTHLQSRLAKRETFPDETVSAYLAENAAEIADGSG
jgi:hypothetical protein